MQGTRKAASKNCIHPNLEQAKFYSRKRSAEMVAILQSLELNVGTSSGELTGTQSELRQILVIQYCCVRRNYLIIMEIRL